MDPFSTAPGRFSANMPVPNTSTCVVEEGVPYERIRPPMKDRSFKSFGKNNSRGQLHVFSIAGSVLCY